jgi:glyoxylase-like metal-dependent hydrolase (beta-lactamase superfamily II)
MSLLPFLLACSVTRIQDGAVFGPVTQVKTSFTSAALIHDGSEAVLFDAGFERDAGAIADALEAAGLSLEDISKVFLTHGHTDHTRGLEGLPGVELLALEAERGLLSEEAGVALDTPLVDGEVVEAAGYAVEVFSVPGHTAGNAVYLVGGVLIMGDTAILTRGGAVEPAPEKYSDDPEQAAAELEALRERLAPRREEIIGVVFAHSGGLEDPAVFFDGS